MSIERIGDWNFEKVLKAFDALKQNDLPLLVGKEAQQHFIKGFRQGGGQTDASTGGWKPRTSKDLSDRRNTDKARAILVKTSHLMRSIKLKEHRFELIRVGTLGIRYAQIHNEGGIIVKKPVEHILSFGGKKNRFVRPGKASFQQKASIGSYEITIPKREFIGKSSKLDAKIISLLRRKIDKVWR